jgi:hypothetical protein
MFRYRIHLAVFLVGIAAVLWVAVGYATTNPLALVVALLIGACYVTGAVELYRYQQATETLVAAVDQLDATPPQLGTWLERLHPGLRGAVRLRVEGERAGLPGPALTPYLVGLLVLLGMLGTLLGMAATLRGTGAALDSATDLEAVRASLAAPVRGLGFAFGTSIAGVATSAMLGLLSALCRRDRIKVAQRLDAKLATVLRVFSPAHQREETFRLMQRQADAMPALLDGLRSLMGSLEQHSAAAGARQLEAQQAFHAKTELAYARLTNSVEQSLRQSVGEHARAVGAAIQPAVETTLASLARDTTALHERVAQAAQQQMEGLSRGFSSTAEQVATTWTGALDAQRNSNDALAARMSATLDGFAANADTRATKLLDDVAAQLAASAQQLSLSWSDALAQHAQTHGALAARHEAALGAATAAFEAAATAAAASIEARTATLVERVDAAHAALQTSVAAADEQRAAVFTAATAGFEAATTAAAASIESRTAALVERVDASHAAMQAGVAAADEKRLAAFTAATASFEAATTAVAASIESRAAALVERVDASHAALQAGVAAADDKRLAAFTAATASFEAATTAAAASIESRAAALVERVDASHAALQAGVAAADEKRLSAFTAATAGFEAATTAAAASIESRTAALVERVDASHAALQASVAAADEKRLAAWTATLEHTAAALSREWTETGAQHVARQQQICDTLADTARQIAERAQAEARGTIDEIGRLLSAASEAPKAAADVIAELRNSLSESMVRDTAMLEERTRLLQTLATLLDTVNLASTEQRAAIDGLVSTSGELLARVGAQFSSKVESEAHKLDIAAAEVATSAIEMASMGDAFGVAVASFGESNGKLIAHLERIERALEQSLARSDEQLAYYVAQAKEVIDLSVMSQKQIVEDLQQLAGARAS